ncbi:ATP-grasp domain-containing protein [Kangiella sediminilitoris]|uniref:Prokaryotic glutathione synthetase ATP-binding domain-containing protein n=1 Tax=Kangiella sediminilitoris TaxID=1144748 RepID=A0A1B3BE17_9GAMM|nr:hypothetical protein [Kangiella sediminilitoris]AOE50947.1 hypothetical protein KS2013_2243 [Kangiella sediminilitoris]
MNIAIASCQNLPDWEKDDIPFFNELDELGVSYQILAWDSDTDWSQFDACLLRTTWDYQERIDEFMQWIKSVSTQTRLINSRAIVEWNSHKSYLKELEHAGIRITPSEWLQQGQSYDVKALMDKHGWQKGFLKPLVGANARECLRFSIRSEFELELAQKHIDKLCPVEDLVLQPYLSSVETFGETSGIFFGGKYSHGTRKVPVKGDFRVQDDYGASDYVYHLTDDELEQAHKAIQYITEKAGPPLYARVDFLHHKGGPVFVNELELIEPSLFFRHGGRESCKKFAQELVNTLQKTH